MLKMFCSAGDGNGLSLISRFWRKKRPWELPNWMIGGPHLTSWTTANESPMAGVAIVLSVFVKTVVATVPQPVELRIVATAPMFAVVVLFVMTRRLPT